MNFQPPGNDNCASVMETEYAVLKAGMSLRQCIKALLECRVLAMPVVDDDGRYLGQFRKNLLIAAILPQVAVHDPAFDRIAKSLSEGSFEETMDDVRERFAAIADKPVQRYLDTNTPVLHPDDPLVHAMFYLFHGRNFLPVVDQGSGLLVGTISAWDILQSILKIG